MTAPVLAVGDGALGFWRAMREVFPATREVDHYDGLTPQTPSKIDSNWSATTPTSNVHSA